MHGSGARITFMWHGISTFRTRDFHEALSVDPRGDFPGMRNKPSWEGNSAQFMASDTMPACGYPAPGPVPDDEGAWWQEWDASFPAACPGRASRHARGLHVALFAQRKGGVSQARGGVRAQPETGCRPDKAPSRRYPA